MTALPIQLGGDSGDPRPEEPRHRQGWFRTRGARAPPSAPLPAAGGTKSTQINQPAGGGSGTCGVGGLARTNKTGRGGCPVPLHGHPPHLPTQGPQCPLGTGRGLSPELCSAPQIGPTAGIPAVRGPSGEQEGPTAPLSPTAHRSEPPGPGTPRPRPPHCGKRPRRPLNGAGKVRPGRGPMSARGRGHPTSINGAVEARPSCSANELRGGRGQAAALPPSSGRPWGWGDRAWGPRGQRRGAQLTPAGHRVTPGVARAR